MSSLRDFGVRLLNLFRRERLERELDAELRAYLELDVEENVRRGMAPTEAIIVGSKARFRAILLTSITTFVGVAPLVFEPSTFAAHLVPLATSVGFGVLVATALLMLVIPALVALQYRFRAGRGRA